MPFLNVAVKFWDWFPPPLRMERRTGHPWVCRMTLMCGCLAVGACGGTETIAVYGVGIEAAYWTPAVIELMLYPFFVDTNVGWSTGGLLL